MFGKDICNYVLSVLIPLGRNLHTQEIGGKISYRRSAIPLAERKWKEVSYIVKLSD